MSNLCFPKIVTYKNSRRQKIGIYWISFFSGCYFKGKPRFDIWKFQVSFTSPVLADDDESQGVLNIRFSLFSDI